MAKIVLKRQPGRKRCLRAERYMALGFALLILTGALLLWLPLSSAAGTFTPWPDALFTSATSVCVTGLVTVTTATHWSLFGKVVILCLIQLGGLGIVACVTGVMMVFGQRISLGARKRIADSYNLDHITGVVGLVRKIVKGTLCVEALGAVPYAFVFIPEYGLAGGLFRAVFHAVSAFCNAGIDILGEDSLAAYVANPVVNINTMLLIIMGGIGFTVWFDVAAQWKKGRLSHGPKQFWGGLALHTRLAVCITVFLILFGALLILLLDWNHGGSLGPLSAPQKVLAALFQSVTLRTAGFQTIPQQDFTDASACVGLVLMFVGGSPMGTAGGMKTTTVGIVFLMTWAYLHGKESPEVFGRRLRDEDTRTALVVICCGFAAVFGGTVLLSSSSGASFLDVFYEVVSAVGTVGLTRGITGSLGTAAKLVLVALMYAGRLGPITLAMAVTRRAGGRKKSVRLPEKRILIG